MKKGIKKEKTKKRNQTKDKLNNSNVSQELENDNSLSNIKTNNQINEDKNNINIINNINNEEENGIDLFEKDLEIMDENYKNGDYFEPNFEPNFSIIFPDKKMNPIPLFTPSTRLNDALQVEEKNECFIFYYTHKKSLYPTIYNQLIGIRGPSNIFAGKEKDFIYADATSLIFTNQKNFINLNILINEFALPLLEDNKMDENQKNYFIERLINNIHINEYLTYEELFIKLNELNVYLIEHKINNVGLIIVDGINSINSQKVEFFNTDDGKNYKLKFNKYNMPYKGEQNSNKKKKRNSIDNKKRGKSIHTYDNSPIKKHLHGNNYTIKKNENFENSNTVEALQQNIVTLIMNYQEKYNFNLILTVFDYTQDNFYNLNYSGKASYKEMNKNTYTVNTKELQNENCYFTFKLPKVFFPKKIIFIEPINLSLNFNEYIFGLITNPINTQKLVFQVFKKEKKDYRPSRILNKIEYEYK